MNILEFGRRLLSWFVIQRRETPRSGTLWPFDEVARPRPTIAAAKGRPRRIRAKRTRSILHRFRPQTWAQACYQFAREHEGLHAWPKIGWERVRQAVVEPQESGEVLLTIELDLAGADRWQGWRFSTEGRVIDQWGDGARQPKKEE